ncbi:hypothetical protein NECAME_10768 [Necator americanus]|uniref:Uncharacterized protein n=1 Tax=Necator americanus TaxID=51031 RepID=W2T890_NECAM|nr:hypothetical protein NECAME_10768 [Necator americanus]ETN77819.1 hypothetical protein NECAME_10768 [Necator americanus]
MLAYSTLDLHNKYLEKADDDFFYHFGFGTKNVHIPKLFGDTKTQKHFSTNYKIESVREGHQSMIQANWQIIGNNTERGIKR